MKIYLIAAFLMTAVTYPQKSGVVTYKAFYNEKQATDELKEINYLTYNSELEREEIAKNLRFEMHFKDGESLFYMVEGLPSDNYEETNVSITQNIFYGPDRFYNNLATDESLELANIMDREVLIPKKISGMGWKYTEESKMIGNYKCYKATTEYKYHWNGKDRSWPVVAWYAPAIPIRLGPLRYAGLPGLILELGEGYRSWVVEKIDFEPKKEINITRPKRGETMTQEELDGETDKMKKEIMGN